MLGGRGVALGMGKLHLNDLKQMPGQALKMPTKEEEEKPKIIVKKHVDKQTFWAACRATIIGLILIAIGVLMTIVGFFDVEPSLILVTTEASNNNNASITSQHVPEWTHMWQIKAMGYIGPIIMGCGTFILMIACVMTLENRDKHAEIIEKPRRAKIKKKTAKRPKKQNSSSSTLQRPVEDEATGLNVPDISADPSSVHTAISQPIAHNDQPCTSQQSIIHHHTTQTPQLESIEEQRKLEEENRANACALLNRFLDDQSRLAQTMQRKLQRRNTTKSLGSADCQRPAKRMTRSEEMQTIMRDQSHTIAQVHNIAPEVRLAVASTSEHETTESMSGDTYPTPLTAHSSRLATTTHSSLTGRNSDASYVTAYTSHNELPTTSPPGSIRRTRDSRPTSTNSLFGIT